MLRLKIIIYHHQQLHKSLLSLYWNGASHTYYCPMAAAAIIIISSCMRKAGRPLFFVRVCDEIDDTISVSSGAISGTYWNVASCAVGEYPKGVRALINTFRLLLTLLKERNIPHYAYNLCIYILFEWNAPTYISIFLINYSLCIPEVRI